MGLSGLLLLIGWLLELLVLVVLVRVILSWIPHVDPHHPFVRVVRAIADPVLAPFHGLLPAFGGVLDLSPILAVIVLEVVAQLVIGLAQNLSFGGISPLYVVLSAVEQILLTLVVIVIVLVLLRFLVALFRADPRHLLTRGIRSMAAPFCRPFEGITTPSRGSTLDAAALIATLFYIAVFVAVQIIFNRIILPAVA